MSSSTTHRTDAPGNGTVRRRSTETQAAAYKTTEFIAYVVITVAVLIASVVRSFRGRGFRAVGGTQRRR